MTYWWGYSKKNIDVQLAHHNFFALFFTLQALLKLEIYTLMGYILTSIYILCTFMGFKSLALHVIACLLSWIYKTTAVLSHRIAVYGSPPQVTRLDLRAHVDILGSKVRFLFLWGSFSYVKGRWDFTPFCTFCTLCNVSLFSLQKPQIF